MRSKLGILFFAVCSLCFLGRAKALIPIDKCIQDQYKGRYNIVLQTNSKFITGSYETPAGAECDSTGSIILGSYTDVWGSGPFELTVQLPPNSNPKCGFISIFKIKGTFKEAKWFYTFSETGAEPFQVVPCGSK